MATKKKRKKKSGTKKRKRGLNIDKAREKQKEMEERSGSDFHEVRQGANYFFIMPPWDDDEDVLWHEVQQHGMLVCPRTTVGKKCILCVETRKRAKKNDQDFVDKHRLRSRAFLNAIRKEDIKDKEPSNVKVLALSPTVFQELLDYITDEEKDISDPHAAVPICIKRKGTGLNTRYKVRFGEEVDISRYITDEVMGGLWDLSALKAGQPASIKDLRKAIRGAADDEFGDDDEDGFEESDFEDGEEEGEEEVEAEEDELFEDGEEEEGEEEGEDGEEEEFEFEEEGEEEPEEEEEGEEEPEEEEEGEEDDELDALLEEEEEEEPEPPPKKKKAKSKKKAAKKPVTEKKKKAKRKKK